MKEGDTLYLLKFVSKDSGPNGLRLVRGVTLESSESNEQDATLKLAVRFDAAQYRFDLLNLAVEESMFVEDVYDSCQVLVRVGDGMRNEQLHLIIDML